MKGKLIGLKIKGEFVRCETSCSINITKETTRKTGKKAGRFRSYKSGFIDWSVTVDAKAIVTSLGANIIKFTEAILDEDEVDLMITSRIIGNDSIEYSGKGIAINYDMTAPVSGETTTSLTFQGSGKLNRTFNAFNSIINAMPIQADKPNIVDTRIWQ